MTALTALTVPVTGLAPQTTELYNDLVAELSGVPAGSAEETVIHDSIQTVVKSLVGDSAVEAFGDYLRANLGSDAEREAYELSRRTASGVVRWARAEALLEAYWIIEHRTTGSEARRIPRFISETSPAVMGRPPLHSVPGQVDIALESTQANATAGGRFAVLGTIANRRDRPVWIVAEHTMLLPPPEIWGRGEAKPLKAHFHTLPELAGDQVVRINALGSYVVDWYLEPRPDSLPGASWIDFLLFTPGEYRFTAQVHTWSRPPVLKNGRVTNISDSEIVEGEARIEIDLPILILIVGAVAGGVTAFFIRLVGMRKAGKDPEMGWRTFLWVGGSGAVVAAAIGTVLLSRLGRMDSFISLSINDLWGAMATGFVLEWLELRLLLEPLGQQIEPPLDANPVDDAIGK